MHTYTNLYSQLCTMENLQLAFQRAKKRKSSKEYVQRFEANLKAELGKLQWELMTGIYRPGPLTTFIVRDPKTRKISASHFRDRVVHHAICNVIGPIFESRFIHDSFANRVGKGTSGTLARFDKFMRQVAGKKGDRGYCLKADIRKYFENVDHAVLLGILGRRIKDPQLLDLVRVVLANHKTATPGRGMPLGNLTSQFFANVYLAELDNFVKHDLRAKHYLRYVDDFVIVGKDAAQLEVWQAQIDAFLAGKLRIALHPEKTQIIPLRSGVPLVGFRVFRTHKLIKPSNRRRFMRRLGEYQDGLAAGTTTAEHVQLGIAGWEGYAKQGNTYNLRQEVQKEIANMGMKS